MFSSSSNTSKPKYSPDVFLSFAGKDVRRRFIAHLYNALVGKGIKTFRDDTSLRIGKPFAQELLDAIEESKISIIVVSKGYCQSKWCLKELVKILECSEDENRHVFPIFYKVKPSDVCGEERFDEAMKSLNKMQKKENKPEFSAEEMEEWKHAFLYVGKLHGYRFGKGNEFESEFIERIVNKVCELVPNRLAVGQQTDGLKPRKQEPWEEIDGLDFMFKLPEWETPLPCRFHRLYNRDGVVTFQAGHKFPFVALAFVRKILLEASSHHVDKVQTFINGHLVNEEEPYVFNRGRVPVLLVDLRNPGLHAFLVHDRNNVEVRVRRRTLGCYENIRVYGVTCHELQMNSSSVRHHVSNLPKPKKIHDRTIENIEMKLLTNGLIEKKKKEERNKALRACVVLIFFQAVGMSQGACAPKTWCLIYLLIYAIFILVLKTFTL